MTNKRLEPSELNVGGTVAQELGSGAMKGYTEEDRRDMWRMGKKQELRYISIFPHIIRRLTESFQTKLSVHLNGRVCNLRVRNLGDISYVGQYVPALQSCVLLTQASQSEHAGSDRRRSRRAILVIGLVLRWANIYCPVAC
jgi:hypothetical protein